MSIDVELFKTKISSAFIALLESKRGVAAALAHSIGKPSSFINEVKRGKPVNALHLKAVSLIFGPEKMLELMFIDDVLEQNRSKAEKTYMYGKKGGEIIKQLSTIEDLNPKMFDMVGKQIEAVYKTVVGSNPGKLSRSRNGSSG